MDGEEAIRLEDRGGDGKENEDAKLAEVISETKWGRVGVDRVYAVLIHNKRAAGLYGVE